MTTKIILWIIVLSSLLALLSGCGRRPAEETNVGISEEVIETVDDTSGQAEYRLYTCVVSTPSGMEAGASEAFAVYIGLTAETDTLAEIQALMPEDTVLEMTEEGGYHKGTFTFSDSSELICLFNG